MRMQSPIRFGADRCPVGDTCAARILSELLIFPSSCCRMKPKANAQSRKFLYDYVVWLQFAANETFV